MDVANLRHEDGIPLSLHEDVYWNWLSDKTCISFTLLFTELWMNTPNRNQFDNSIVMHAGFIHNANIVSEFKTHLDIQNGLRR